MTREFLVKLNVEEAAIDKIMAEHGKSIQRYKEAETELETKKQEVKDLENQLRERDKQLELLKSIDAQGLEEKIKELQTENEASKKAYEKRIKEIMFDHALDEELAKAKAKNLKAVKALIELESIEFKDGVLKGAEEQIKTIKKENDYLFEKEEKHKTHIDGAKPAEGISHPGNGVTNEQFASMTYSERLNLYNTDRDTYNQLIEGGK